MRWTKLGAVLVSLACSSHPPLSGSAAAELVERDVRIGMTKSEVKRILGEPRWAMPMAGLPDQVQLKTSSGGELGPECWLWGEDAAHPDATVCFTGIHPTVITKRP